MESEISNNKHNFLKYNYMKFQHHDFEVINKLKKKIELENEKNRFESHSSIKNKNKKIKSFLDFMESELYYEHESNGDIVIVSSNFFAEKNDYSYEMKLSYLAKYNKELHSNSSSYQGNKININFMEESNESVLKDKIKDRLCNLESLNNKITQDIYEKYHGCVYQKEHRNTSLLSSNNSNGNNTASISIDSKKIYFPFKHRPKLLASLNSSHKAEINNESVNTSINSSNNSVNNLGNDISKEINKPSDDISSNFIYDD